MGKTYKHLYTSNLYHNGPHGHHNTLTREFKPCNQGGWTVKGIRGLINTRDYKSDRLKGIRKILNQARRNYLKVEANKIIEEELYT